MDKKVLTGAVAFIIGGIIVKSVKTALDIRRENNKEIDIEIIEGP